MSTRQKSFFDQNPTPKPFKSQWHRPRDAPPAARLDNHTRPPPHVQTGPPIMPSTQTRTRLKKFQFLEGTPPAEFVKDGNADKENAPMASQPKATPKAVKVAEMTGQTSATPRLATAKTFPPPSTPAARLPLAELVGNVDDSSRHMVKPVVSPEEQLCWRGSQPTNTPLPRKRKRARSSSPAAPSQEDSRWPEPPRKDITTPQADPVLELWNRYTNNKGTPSGTKAVAFAHLISESSPRSSANAGSVSGLRRWASCGVEFPASTKKKRRTTGAFAATKEPTGDVFNQPSSEGVIQGHPQEKSKLAGMVERMKESISRPQPRIASQIPSSSSPLPDQERHPLPIDSPLQRRGRDEHTQDTETFESIKDDMETVDDDEARGEERRNSGSSDDFGDFDDEMVDALEITTRVSEPPESQIPDPTESANVDAFPPPEEPAAPPTNDAESDDEFGLDEDIFAADLEQAASFYDNRPEMTSQEQQHQACAVTASAAVPSVIDLVDDNEDDDFGDDIDADEFAAAEFAATQAPATNVRRPRTIRRM
ncbi:hypothetical protein K458DRAFT_65161 [Lentithecium fluviatile CBS 122367]|uniref:Uncharacterized protein n=1 Tax=Lentithecium fluviatile CBS 122367 TaxID=1168545 RepID=A0A6G1JK75_9PLEO|nr:hypothetical protein K458DRAFT_65161 [Lentithecium fluviatile CBS 122367]